MSWHHGRVELDELGAAIWQRITPSAAPEPGWWILAAAVAALIAVVLPPLWRYARLAVTIVHELGHAAVGILVGRRFTGFEIGRASCRERAWATEAAVVVKTTPNGREATLKL